VRPDLLMFCESEECAANIFHGRRQIARGWNVLGAFENRVKSCARIRLRHPKSSAKILHRLIK
jgi:hypothetical protein